MNRLLQCIEITAQGPGSWTMPGSDSLANIETPAFRGNELPNVSNVVTADHLFADSTEALMSCFQGLESYQNVLGFCQSSECRYPSTALRKSRVSFMSTML